MRARSGPVRLEPNWNGWSYTAAEIQGAADQVAGHTELEALIAYLQGLKYHGDAER